MRAAGAVVVAAALVVAGCAYLLDSPFPSYVPLLVAEQDVEDEMPYEEGAHYELRVVSSPSGDYVWLYGEGSGFGERFVLFDAELRPVLQGADAGDTFYGGSPLVFGPTHLCIGRQVYDASTFARLPDANPGFGGDQGFYDPGMGHFVFPYMTFPDSINWQSWSDPYTNIGPIGAGTVSAGLYSYGGFAGLGHDVPGNRVALYARVDFPLLLQGAVAPASGFSSISWNPLIDDARAFTIIPDNGDFERPQFAGDGTVIRYHEDDLLVFYDLAGNQGDSISVREAGESAYGFSPRSRYWYIYTAETGRLMKARTWW